MVLTVSEWHCRGWMTLMKFDRRNFLIAGSAFTAGALLPGISLSQERTEPRVILLGTKGGPSLGKIGRSNPSTLILYRGLPFVVDCGYGVSRQLIAAGVSLDQVRYIFVTHHHSD